MRILVVEDEETLAQRIANILEGENYSVETAFRGDDGLEMALTEEYDLLLLDILLPGRIELAAARLLAVKAIRAYAGVGLFEAMQACDRAPGPGGLPPLDLGLAG